MGMIKLSVFDVSLINVILHFDVSLKCNSLVLGI